ncbi:YciI family protein [Arthrobacter sp. DNA4]|uniref:YciI family protein n=1 Tax=Micrococcaceae TaxID=1268 RepID=UPI0020CF75EA|nr:MULTISPECIES: YciI family protein [Micrococcaceae]UTT68737.1 YciI family protein [Arthrobacter sp. DNA4]WRT12984.1 YciI family protein [Pseudarthrobacter sp. LT1]
MSKYLILIYQDEAVARQAEGESISASYQEFQQRRGASLLSGAALHPSSTATSVRRDGDGGFLVTDGPFAESKETLGGYYLIDAADLDEALEIAKEVPAGVGVEVWPVRVAN